MAASIRSSASWATGNSDQTIASVVAGDTVVYMGAASNGDPVQRAVDSAPTLGGTAMTSANPSGNYTAAASQNNQVDLWIYPNHPGGTNLTLHTSYHLAPAGYMGTWYVVQGASSTQSNINGSNTNTAAANPSIALAGLTTNDLILEIIAANATPTAGSSQTSDFTGTGNSSSFLSTHKTAASGTNTESMTLTSTSYAYGAVAIQGTGGGGGATNTGQFFAFM